MLAGNTRYLYEMYKDKGITKVVGIESRGFIKGGAGGTVRCRIRDGTQPGKLPQK